MDDNNVRVAMFRGALEARLLDRQIRMQKAEARKDVRDPPGSESAIYWEAQQIMDLFRAIVGDEE